MATNTSALKLITQYLDDLHDRLQKDPALFSALQQLPRIALRKSTPSGSKFWIGSLTTRSVALRWGKRGTQGTSVHIQRAGCENRNQVLELKKRAVDKLRKGYDLIPAGTILP